MDKSFYIYSYTRLDKNTYFYIGKGKGKRCFEHYSGRNNHFKNIINKIEYRIDILYDNLTEEEALELEITTIHNLVFNEGYSIDIKGYNIKSDKHLTNQTWGGEGISGYKHTEEDKLKCGLNGEKNGMYGKRGELSPHFGKEYSEEHKEKIKLSNPNRKEVYCVELDIYFNSYREAEKILFEKYNINCSHATISAVCRGKRKHGGRDIQTGELLHLHFINKNV
jgi:hypothetical protein